MTRIHAILNNPSQRLSRTASMPTADFFRKFGLFALEGFFDRDLCSQLCADVRAGIPSSGLIGSGKVDREIRRVNKVKVNNVSTALVRTRLIDVRPNLERHFDTVLTDCQGPQFLHYVTGDFYQYHRDEEATSATPKSRRISAVIFLNGTSAEPRDSMYGGGALTFYELLDDPTGRSLGFPLQAEEGLLVAFRADVPHSVTAVTHGDRYTIASWYI
jgi:predicted 2-oxoglutarate/Fe(II)-dependent dioxygenase YbiX